ncbi:MAG TPA: hypothetical protein VMZ52_16575, partial [Bryobacteraceae bacterium]|nr:hypothetical protein [Bryobacteraceae bacterium]
ARVYDGEVVVARGSDTLTLKEGREAALTGVLAPQKFDSKTGDAFYRWASRRAGYLALANVSAAKSLLDNGTSWQTSGWGFNPYLGAYTFIPSRSFYSSPFGYRFYGPSSIMGYYENLLPVYHRPQEVWAGNSGSGNTSPRYNADLGYSTAPRSAAPSYSAPAPAVSSPGNAGVSSGEGARGADSGSTRSGGHGR